MSASVLHMSMSLDEYIAVRTTNRATPAATASTGCTGSGNAASAQPRLQDAHRFAGLELSLFGLEGFLFDLEGFLLQLLFPISVRTAPQQVPARYSTLANVVVARLEPPASRGPGVPSIQLQLFEPAHAANSEVAAALSRGPIGFLLRTALLVNEALFSPSDLVGVPLVIASAHERAVEHWTTDRLRRWHRPSAIRARSRRLPRRFVIIRRFSTGTRYFLRDISAFRLNCGLTPGS